MNKTEQYNEKELVLLGNQQVDKCISKLNKRLKQNTQINKIRKPVLIGQNLGSWRRQN